MSEKMQNSSICLSCGLCCDGTLHSYTSFSKQENANPRKLKNSRIQLVDSVNTRFEQPCIEYCEKSGCNIYPHRPKTCVNYKCTLLRRVEAGKIGRAKALAKIAATKKHRDALNDYFEDKVCFIKPLNLMSKFLLLHGHQVNDKEKKKAFAKANKKLFAAYFAFDVLLDDFIQRRRKFGAGSGRSVR